MINILYCIHGDQINCQFLMSLLNLYTDSKLLQQYLELLKLFCFVVHCLLPRIATF